MPEQNIDELKLEIKELREELERKENLLRQLQFTNEKNIYNDKLGREEIVRYSRQMIMPNIGTKGQLLLKNSKVLLVGVGGLGCPASLYLASAGVGEITILDYDEVELSNLHRQILHSESQINNPKIASAYNTLKSINSSITIIPLRLHANSDTLKDIFAKNKYNVVIDGSDNVATRYLLNDVCVINNIPLVSGSALQMEGQLTVYHYQGGPCYRCIFPIPPPPETVTSCGDGGVLGAVPGTIGVLQALETIKILTNSPGVLTGRLLMFDAENTTFRNIRLRNRNAQCEVCGDTPNITRLIDYEKFCQSNAHDKVINIDMLTENEQVSIKNISSVMKDYIVLDVRPELEYEMCRLPYTINFPFAKIKKNAEIEKLSQLFERRLSEKNEVFVLPVYVLCRRGNDSQRAIILLREKFSDMPVKFYNVKGGLYAYAKHIDPTFPVY